MKLGKIDNRNLTMMIKIKRLIQILENYAMEMRWNNQRAIAKSKIVKSSAIWLFVVPLMAKLLSKLDSVIELTFLGGLYRFSTNLPFTWQLLFFTAVSFTVASIIYSLFCPELIKEYINYTDFKSDGKSRMQINNNLKKLTWDSSTKCIKNKYISTTKKYFKLYGNQHIKSDDDLNKKALFLFDNIDQSSITGKNSNAFYFVYELSDKHGILPIWLSLISYIIGFCCLSIIALQNIYYVMKTFG